MTHATGVLGPWSLVDVNMIHWGHQSLCPTPSLYSCLWLLFVYQEWGTACQALPSSFQSLWAHCEGKVTFLLRY